MTYKETLDWMFAQLPMYQHQGASAYKKDLTNTLALMTHLDNPEKDVKCVHVAGTNGKGSVSNMLASILHEAGYKVGLYTSPHLKDFRERVKINGVDIAEEYVVSFIQENKSFFEKHQLSFFEMTVGLAFSYFKEKAVDIAIIETGMGGRLDSTNVITPLISVITNIGMDHTQFLGNTLEAIAYEKAGIIKQGIPVVIGEYTYKTKPVFIKRAAESGAPVFFASDEVYSSYDSDLTGDYQHQNKKTVLATVAVLQKTFTISKDNIREGFSRVMANTGFMGRWQKIHSYPEAYCDTAHNSHGLKIVLNQIAKLDFEVLRVVFGVVNDKDLNDILPLMPKAAIYYFCRPNVPRGLDPFSLKEASAGYSLIGEVYSSVAEAYSAALNESSSNDFIYVGGSTFVVAEIL